MSRIAVCDSTTNVVLSVIIAEPGDPTYPDTYFYVLGEGELCNPGWICTGNAVYDPNPQPEG